jgi:hypothetical protein
LAHFDIYFFFHGEKKEQSSTTTCGGSLSRKSLAIWQQVKLLPWGVGRVLNI